MGVDLFTVSSTSFTDAMCQFLQKYDGHPAIQSCFKSGEVQESLSTLVQFLVDHSSNASSQSSEIIQALQCVKLLTRTRAELDVLLEEPNIACIIGLASPDVADSDPKYSIANEAIRVLINLCMIRQQDALWTLHRHRVYIQLLDLLNEVRPGNDDLIFAISRLLFYVCLDDGVQRHLRDDSNTVRLLADKIVKYVDSSDPGGMSLRSTGVNATCAALSELLRVLFALGSNQDSKSDCQQLWQSLTAPLLRLLLGQQINMLTLSNAELQTLPKSSYYGLMLDIVHLFYCFDESNLRFLLGKDVIHRILQLLEVQARYNCASLESALVPILTVLRNLCELSLEVAQDTKEFIFGEEFANDKSLKYEFEAGDTTLSISSAAAPVSHPPPLYKILRQLITTFNPNVNDVVSRFLFTICGQEGNEYIRVDFIKLQCQWFLFVLGISVMPIATLMLFISCNGHNSQLEINMASGYNDNTDIIGMDLDNSDRDDRDVLYDKSCYDCVKRAPIRAEARVSDIYVRRGLSESRTVALLSKRALYLLLDQMHEVVRIYSVGAAMITAINVALEVKKREPGVILRPTTSSLCLYDDFEPKKPGLTRVTRARTSSQICIELSMR